ncbi:MAG TPA: hypothetical protein VMU46_00085 [Burkholderiales bacterium]|nr:hypothetical protein [Burkholderiales bacterium]
MNAGKRRLLLAFTAILLAWGGSSFAARGFIDKLEILDQIRPGVTTAEEVTKLLGPPANVMKFPSQGIETLEYTSYDRLQISIAIGSDGKVRDITRRTPSF